MFFVLFFYLDVSLGATISLIFYFFSILIWVSKILFFVFFSILNLRVLATVSLSSTDCRFWFEFQKSAFRLFGFFSLNIHIEVSVGATLRLILTASRLWFGFRKSDFCRFFFFFCRYFSWSCAAATISLSFDWYSILIRISKIVLRFFTLKLVWERLSRSGWTAFLFWFEFRKPVLSTLFFIFQL